MPGHQRRAAGADNGDTATAPAAAQAEAVGVDAGNAAAQAALCASPTQPFTHTVVSGNTLWGLAKEYLGDGRRYPEIVSINQEKDLTPLAIGTVLRIPAADPNSAASGMIDMQANMACHPAGAQLTLDMMHEAILTVMRGGTLGEGLASAAQAELWGLSDADWAVVLNSLQTMGLLDDFLDALPEEDRESVLAVSETLLTVNVTVFHGANAGRVETDFATANEYFNPHGISVEQGVRQEVDEAGTQALMGGNTRLRDGATAMNDGRGVPNPELANVLATNRSAGRLTGYWIEEYDASPRLRGRAYAKVWWDTINEGVVVKNGGAVDTFPHELGHILMQANHVDLDGHDEDGDGVHDEDNQDISPRNLMDDGGSRIPGGGQLTDEQVEAFKRSVYMRFRG